MTLSAAEKKMIERLQKREAAMRRWRWPLAIIHSGVVLTALIMLVVLAQFPDDIPNAKPTMVAFVLPQLFLLLAASSLWLGYLIVNWHGNAKTHLLLRLLADQV